MYHPALSNKDENKKDTMPPKNPPSSTEIHCISHNPRGSRSWKCSREISKQHPKITSCLHILLQASNRESKDAIKSLTQPVWCRRNGELDEQDKGIIYPILRFITWYWSRCASDRHVVNTFEWCMYDMHLFNKLFCLSGADNKWQGWLSSQSTNEDWVQ